MVVGEGEGLNLDLDNQFGECVRPTRVVCARPVPNGSASIPHTLKES